MNRADARGGPRGRPRRAVAIARAVELIVDSLSRGGRLVFVGRGTSGRLGVLEAAECPPTFGTPPSLVQAVIAGGRRAVFRSAEGAEDDAAEGARQLRRRARRGRRRGGDRRERGHAVREGRAREKRGAAARERSW